MLRKPLVLHYRTSGCWPCKYALHGRVVNVTSIGMMIIDWNNPKCNISEHFTVHDATYLPRWQCYHQPSDEEKATILRTAETMEKVREVLGKPLNVHCWIRPTSVNNSTSYHGKNYNATVGGATHSAHITGEAVDFNPIGLDCGQAREVLLPELDKLQVRMENREGPWVHIDIRQPLPGHPRYFRP
jgi:hypothetical protein